MFYTPFYRRIWPIMRALTPRWFSREHLKTVIAAAPRDELEQTALRVLIVGAVLAYLFWYVLRDGTIEPAEFEVLAVTSGFLAFGVVLVLCVLAAPHESVPRRFIGMIGDNAVTTYFLSQMGEGGAVILFVYLFITFGNGFRFGRLYLHACQVMGLAGFWIVLVMSPFWSKHQQIWLAFLIALIVLPFYVGKLAERLKEARKHADDANLARGRFLANVSHEMRTPLNGVIAMADVLRETSLNESQREIVDTLGTSANLLLAQIEDVLDMAKIEAGRVQIEKMPFDLGKLLTSSVKVVLPQARYKGLAVNTEIAPETARWFVGDAHHLRQVLLNLLSNAIKFTERGEITLRVAAANVGESEARIRFEVKDTGIGIPPEKQSIIFEPFAQADDSITRVYGGTGLGTTIARQLVSLMGGEIGLVSDLGIGSLFWVELPLPFSEPIGFDLTSEIAASERLSSASAAFAAQQTAKVTKIRGARVLVAEDNPTNQRVTQLILESGGHHATIVDNGEGALDALERDSFDLALFDLSMPIVSGLEALKLYQFTTRKPIPILILSANVTSEIVADCQRAGCAEFIAKPVRPTVLLDAIERHLAAMTEVNAGFVPPRAEERPTLTVIDTPIVDKNVLRDLDRLSNDPTFVERLVRGFRSDIDRLVKSISDALAARRYEDVKDAAHALKGGAGSVGASQLVQLTVRFEKASHETLRIRAAAWMEELTHAASMSLAALDQHVEERRRQTRG
jgi:two-component system sensor histidine kinase RpfC